MSWLTVDLSPLNETIARFGGMTPLLQWDIQQYLKSTAGPLLQRHAVQNVSGIPFPAARAAGANPPIIRKRTGTLSFGIEYETPYMGMLTALRLYADARTYEGVNYAKTLHDGAVITPKRAKCLVFRVPLDQVKNPNYQRTLNKTQKWAKAATYRANLDDTNSVLVFAKRVVIKPRPFLSDAWDKVRGQVVEDLQGVVMKRFEGQS